jgi:hypothetical protein
MQPAHLIYHVDVIATTRSAQERFSIHRGTNGDIGSPGSPKSAVSISDVRLHHEDQNQQVALAAFGFISTVSLVRAEAFLSPLTLGRYIFGLRSIKNLTQPT